jgi:hypothetical protein
MSEVTDVRLPSGELVKNVPVGMSQTELQDLLIKNEKVSPDVFAHLF